MPSVWGRLGTCAAVGYRRRPAGRLPIGRTQRVPLTTCPTWSQRVSLASSPRWVATETSGGRINVPANSSVVRIGCGLCMRVAVDAGKYRVVGGVRMAVPARGPDSGVGTGIERELAMGESGAAPGGGGVAIGAGGGESGRRVVGVISGGVLSLVARVTIRRRAREYVVDVAACTGRVDVGPGERKLGGAVIE